jgi:hypothetical protein
LIQGHFAFGVGRTDGIQSRPNPVVPTVIRRSEMDVLSVGRFDISFWISFWILFWKFHSDDCVRTFQDIGSPNPEDKLTYGSV